MCLVREIVLALMKCPSIELPLRLNGEASASRQSGIQEHLEMQLKA
jgi:hypothetical protein